MTAEGKSLKESYQWQAKSQFKGKILEGDVSVYVGLFLERKIGDIDNFNKILFDSLTGIVWKDDKQIKHFSISKYVDKNNPRIEITVT